MSCQRKSQKELLGLAKSKIGAKPARKPAGLVHAWREGLGTSPTRARSGLRGLGRIGGSSQLYWQAAAVVKGQGSYGRCPGPQARQACSSGNRSTQHAIDAAAQAADVAPNGKSTSACPKAAADRGAAKKHTRWARRARRREDKR